MVLRRSDYSILVGLWVILSLGIPVATVVAGDRSLIQANGWPIDSAPIEDTAAEDPTETEAANGVAFFRFIGAAGAASATDSDLEYSYSGAGCMSATGNLAPNGEWDVDLHFLHDEQITFLRFYFFDDDPVNDVGAFLFKFDGQGGLSTLADLSSSGTPGFSSAGINLSHLVNNATGGLVLRFHQDAATTNDLRACAARLVYLPS